MASEHTVFYPKGQRGQSFQSVFVQQVEQNGKIIHNLFQNAPFTLFRKPTLRSDNSVSATALVS